MILESDKKPGELTPNISTLLKNNVQRFAERIVFQEKVNDQYAGTTWKECYNNILNIAFHLKQLGFSEGEKMVIFSRNCKAMLEMELAVMSIGGIAVPIFAGFKKDTAELLMTHSEATYLAVEGEQQLSYTPPKNALKKIIVFERNINPLTFTNTVEISELRKDRIVQDFSLNFSASPDDTCLEMYTSGTMGIPKCVQLSHRNILSQQAALDSIDWWNLNEEDRFLSYLPWHHSFGGIFELFNALYRGATYSLESGYGKDAKTIFDNWKKIQPTVFFSVPKVYQALFELTKESKEAEELFFHSGLKFVFTAAAPMPENISREFEKRKIPVIEGWGLTETSPCCTLTNPKLMRETGVVGKPIPGVSIRLGEENEIQVKGPNVMSGYYKNDEANKNIFTHDGWFRTGDVGEITENGLKLITRKDRIFKLTNGEKVIPTEMESIIQGKCHYISFAVVTGGGREYPVALLFPNKKMIENPDYEVSPLEGCFCPRNLNELSHCLQGCLNDANCGVKQKFAKIKAAMIIDDELSIDKGTLTPSMKVAPNNVLKAYKAELENIYEGDDTLKEKVYVIYLRENNEQNTLNQKQPA